MIVVTCENCGRKIIWDDFQPTAIRCPNCDRLIDVHQSLRRNLTERARIEKQAFFRCAGCGAYVAARWFRACPECHRIMLGGWAVHRKWLGAFVLGVAYVIFTLCYLLLVV